MIYDSNKKQKIKSQNINIQGFLYIRNKPQLINIY